MCIRAINWALNVQVGDNNAKLVLVSLADNADDETLQCWPSSNYVARRAEISRASVYRAYKYLKDNGFLTYQKRRHASGSGRSPLITLLVDDKLCVLNMTDSHPETPPSHPETPPSHSYETPRLTGETIKEPSLEPSKNLTEKSFGIWIEAGSEQWRAWDAHYRKTRGVGPPGTTHEGTYGWYFKSEWPL